MGMNVPVVHYDATELQVIMTTPMALLFWIVGSLAIIAGLFFVYKIEKEYPHSPGGGGANGEDNTTNNGERNNENQEDKNNYNDEEVASDGVVKSEQAHKSIDDGEEGNISVHKTLSPRMHLCARILYPVTLGCIEAFGTALLKGINSLLTVYYS